jgi:putative membrane protein
VNVHLLIRFIINAIVLYCIVRFVPGFTDASGAANVITPMWAIILAIVFGVVNALIGSILRLLSAPITWLTHGLFSVVINWIVFAIAIRWTDLRGTWQSNLIGAIIMMIVSTVLQQAWQSDAEKVRT